ncbi:MAG: 6-phosphogluconolactonase [Candidatus Saccharimonadales bacterium]
MRFIRAEIAVGERQLSQQLTKSLSDRKRTLWLISGGSNIAISTRVMAGLPQNLTARLSIRLSDERYGPAGHADSNTQQLLDAGFKLKDATFTPVIQGESLDLTLKSYSDDISRQFDQSEVIIAQLGIGPDGHTAGILPNSIAAQPSHQLVVSYQAADFRRLTLSFKALAQIDTAFVFAYGAAKKPALEQLRDQNLSLARQPAQILKRISRAYIYNDSVEGES